jgi:hypothetical protein
MIPQNNTGDPAWSKSIRPNFQIKTTVLTVIRQKPNLRKHPDVS